MTNSKLCGFGILLAMGISHALSANAAKTIVSVYLLEALAPRDSTSSEVFRKEFESTVELSKKLINQQIGQCGFQIDTKINFYSANDNLQAYERASEAEKSGVWLIVGPRRSNHYLLL